MNQEHTKQYLVKIPLSDVTLEGKLAFPAASRRLIIFVQGCNSGYLNFIDKRIAQILRSEGLGILSVDLLAGDEDSFCGNRFDADFLARRLKGVTIWFKNQPFGKGVSVGYFGSGNAAAVALKAAAFLGREVKAVVSYQGRLDLVGETIERIESPTQLILGSFDREVLEANYEAYDQINAKKRVSILRSADHPQDEMSIIEEAGDQSAHWFLKYLKTFDREKKMQWRSIEIAFIGNIMLGGKVNEKLKSRSATYPWGDTLAVLGEADVRIGNLECAITKEDRVSRGTFASNFCTDIKNIEVLKAGEMDILSLANDHILDCGTVALSDTLRYLREAKIKCAGAGDDNKMASQPVFCNLRDTMISFIAFAEAGPEAKSSPAAQIVLEVPIDVNHPRAKDLFKLISSTKQKTDLLIVSAHWKNGGKRHPTPRQSRFSRSLIDAGADIVYGHSDHTYLGIELYREKPILYGTGNPLTDYSLYKRREDTRSFIFVTDIGDGRLRRILLYPLVIKNYACEIAPTSIAREMAGEMIKLCADLGARAVWRDKCNYIEIKNLKFEA